MKITLSITTVAAILTFGSAAVEAESCASLYGQCGGEGWTGPTCCVSGATCQAQKNNIYYSQCLPPAAGNGKTSTTTKKSTTKKHTTTTKKHTTTTTTKAATSTGGSSSGGNSSSGGSDYSVISGGSSGSGTTTRYWDCCKASCSWPGKASVSSPVGSCAKDGITLLDSNTGSACAGGSSYMCNSNQPYKVNDNLSYGFAAANIAGSNEAGWCCGCYEITFTSTSIAGKKMVVQVTNTGGDLGANHFDLEIPGGGVGVFNGCSQQWGAPSSGWGARYGGISSQSDCASLPTQLQAGCKWRFGWFENADNPTMTFKQVTCPKELTAKTGCSRN